MARVRAVCGSSMSSWTTSNELIHDRDVTLGPPKIVLQVQGQKLQVNVTTSLASLLESGAFDWVREGLQGLKCDITIYEEQQKVDTHSCTNLSAVEIHYTFSHTPKNNTSYCAEAFIRLRQKVHANATNCIWTPPGPPDLLSIALVVACILGGLIFCCSLVMYYAIKYMHPNPSTMRLPGALAVQTEWLDVDLPSLTSGQSLEVDPISLSPMERPSQEGESDTEGEAPSTQLLPGDYEFHHDNGYHNNSLGQDYCASEASSGTAVSCPSTQVWRASSVMQGRSSSLEEGYFGSSAISSVPQIPVSLQAQPEWSSSASEGSGGHTVLPACTQAPPPLSPGTAEHTRRHGTQCQLDIPLNSVMLLACVEPLDVHVLSDFCDTEESTEEDSPDSHSVGSSQENSPPLQQDQSESLEHVAVSECCYDTRPTFSPAQEEHLSCYELQVRDYAPHPTLSHAQEEHLSGYELQGRDYAPHPTLSHAQEERLLGYELRGRGYEPGPTLSYAQEEHLSGYELRGRGYEPEPTLSHVQEQQL